LNRIPAVFANYFERWQISLPDGAVEKRLSDKIQSSGWTIHYQFGVNDRGEFLDFYASHRMTNDRHMRIYASGETEGLPALWDMLIYPVNATAAQKKQIEHEHNEHNKRVMDELKRKGFC